LWEVVLGLAAWVAYQNIPWRLSCKSLACDLARRLKVHKPVPAMGALHDAVAAVLSTATIPADASAAVEKAVSFYTLRSQHN